MAKRHYLALELGDSKGFKWKLHYVDISINRDANLHLAMQRGRRLFRSEQKIFSLHLFGLLFRRKQIPRPYTARKETLMNYGGRANPVQEKKLFLLSQK
uniref:Uncharacterized protein n=1 Tax=Nelumbo nucifera TaxID=4432 RepID=A0A822XDR1_NELNU|nr:TPA_asm: hypothetical protein HUJ06_019780 [Nelumbo nucifera]